MGDTLENSEGCPDPRWLVDFMKLDKEGRLIKESSWYWTGTAFNARIALEFALDAMIDEKSEEADSWRCVKVAMDLRAVFVERE